MGKQPMATSSKVQRIIMLHSVIGIIYVVSLASAAAITSAPTAAADIQQRENDSVLMNSNGSSLNSRNVTKSPALAVPTHGHEDKDIAYAVEKGFVAQTEYCNVYCREHNSYRYEFDCVGPAPAIECSKCFCDEACKPYRDCCPSLGNGTVPDVAETGTHLCKKITFGFELRFVKVIRSCSVASDTRRVDGCPHCGGEAESLAAGGARYLAECRCENESSLALSLDSKAVYCNADCALCNGDTNLVSLPPTTCADTGETVYVWNRKDVNRWLIPPARQCDQDSERLRERHIDTCKDTAASDDSRGVETAALCQLYSYPVRFGNVSYRNMFCALCNGERLHTRNACQMTVPVDIVAPLLVLTSVNDHPPETYVSESVRRTNCSDDEWYDSVMENCRGIVCLYDRIRVPGQFYCEDSIALMYYTLSLSFNVVTNLTHVPCLRDWNLFSDAIRHHLVQTIEKLNVSSHDLRVHDFDAHYGSCTADVAFFSLEGESQTDFELKVIDFFNHSHQLFGRSAVPFEKGVIPFWLLTSEGSYVIGKSLASFPSDSARKYPSRTNEFYPTMPYAHVLLNDAEYEYLDDGGLMLTSTNTTLAYWQMARRSEGLYVPIVYLQRAYEAAGLLPEPPSAAEEARRYDPTQSTVYSCCLVVSMVSLVFLLATYGTFSQLRSLPGLNNMWLAAWLLLAQLLLLIEPELTEADGCHVLGMSLHYAWLCVFSWSSVCSVHMFNVFVSQRDQMHAPHRESWYTKRYVALAHAVPAAVVGLVVGCTMILTEGRETGYGSRACFLDTAVLRGVAFLLPLALMVTSNVALLAMTVHSLSRAERGRTLGKRSEPNYIRIYAKLSSLTGCCWVFALVAELPGCGWMVYVSIVLNGLQGFFLAVSYAGNRRVLTMWREKVCGKKKEQNTGTSESKERPGVPVTDITHTHSSNV